MMRHQEEPIRNSLHEKSSQTRIWLFMLWVWFSPAYITFSSFWRTVLKVKSHWIRSLIFVRQLVRWPEIRYSIISVRAYCKCMYFMSLNIYVDMYVFVWRCLTLRPQTSLSWQLLTRQPTMPRGKEMYFFFLSLWVPSTMIKKLVPTKLINYYCVWYCFKTWQR